MPYFFILPVFVFATVVCAGAIVVARRRERGKRVVRFLMWGYGGAFVGFIVANVLVNLIGFLLVRAIGGNDPTTSETAVGTVAVGLLFIGPFFASVVGAGIGGWLGIQHVRRQ